MNEVTTAALVLLALASTFGAGLELDASRITRGGATLRAAGVTFVANVLIIPALTWVVLEGLLLPKEVRHALILVALAPGGASGPLLTRIAGGDPTRDATTFLALSIASAAMASTFAAGDGLSALAAVAFLCVQVLPLAVGFVVRVRQPRLAARLSATVRRSGNFLLVATIVGLAATRGSQAVTLGGRTLMAIVAGVGISLVVGAALAVPPRAPAAVLSCIRNLTLALLITEAGAPGGQGTLVVAAYGLVMYAAAALVLVVRKARLTSKSLPLEF